MERNQAKWVGIRGVAGMAPIPVTGVRPAGTVSHLQMIKEAYAAQMINAGVDCSGEFNTAFPDVPPDEIWVVTNATVINLTSMCDMSIRVEIGGTRRDVKSFYSIPKNIAMSWDGMLVLEEDDQMWGGYFLGGATDDVEIYVHGYKIGVY